MTHYFNMWIGDTGIKDIYIEREDFTCRYGAVKFHTKHPATRPLRCFEDFRKWVVVGADEDLMCDFKLLQDEG